MLQKLQNNKIIFIILLVALLFIFCNSSYGFSDDVKTKIDQTASKIPLAKYSNAHYVVGNTYGDLLFVYYTANTDIDFIFKQEGSIYLLYGYNFSTKTYEDIYFDVYHMTDAKLSSEKTLIAANADNNNRRFNADTSFYNNKPYIATGYGTLYNSDLTIFFQIAPPEVTLMKPTQVEEIPAVVKKVIQAILPTGLVIFGILLLVYLIASGKWLLH